MPAPVRFTKTWPPSDGPGLQGVKNGKLFSGRPATHDVILDLVNQGQESVPALVEVSAPPGCRRDDSEGATHRNFFGRQELEVEASRHGGRLRNKDEVSMGRATGW